MSVLNDGRPRAVAGTVTMAPEGDLAVAIAAEPDLLRVRSTLRAHAQTAGLSLTATTKLVTAGSELARNILRYATGGRGTVSIGQCRGAQHGGVRAVFCDKGPGIADLDAAMRDGFSTAGGLGLGLPGSRRLVDEFHIDSVPGRGTVVVIELWTRLDSPATAVSTSAITRPRERCGDWSANRPGGWELPRRGPRGRNWWPPNWRSTWSSTPARAATSWRGRWPPRRWS
jgi:serine/threonine-protein kinase RsbT